MWQLFALYSAFSWGVINLVNKVIMKDVKASVYAFYFNLVGALMFLVFFNEFQMPTDPIGWFFAITMGILWAVAMYAGFNVYKHLDVSLIAPLSNTSPALILLLSVFLLGESFTLGKVLGITLVIIGSIIIAFRAKRRYKVTDEGIYLLIASLLLVCLAQINDKVAINYFTPGFYGFLAYMLPSLFLMPFALKDKKALRMSKKNWILTLITSALTFSSYYLILIAYGMTEISNISPIIQLNVIISMIGGYYFFKEKNMTRKIAGAATIIFGVLFII